MPILAGVDGCPAGWICVTRDMHTGNVQSALYHNAAALINQEPHVEVMTVDIPIGLTAAGPRECDTVARRLLGEPRRRSVFPTPIRPALHANTHQQASAITQAADGRNVAIQSWSIYPKVLDMDTVLSNAPGLQDRVMEIHPELCFWEWNGQNAMAHSKKTVAGRQARRLLIDQQYGVALWAQIREAHPVQNVGHDDISDAIAALWTAERISDGLAVSIPVVPPVDAMGLRMEMWY